MNDLSITESDVDGIHALTDVTGFGLLGHLLEMCRGAELDATIDLAAVPLLRNARASAVDGSVTGASHRNLASYGADVVDGPAQAPIARLLPSDPQTSGGLLVAVAPAALATTLSRFRDAGFPEVAVIGRFTAGDTSQSRVTIG